MASCTKIVGARTVCCRVATALLVLKKCRGVFLSLMGKFMDDSIISNKWFLDHTFGAKIAPNVTIPRVEACWQNLILVTETDCVYIANTKIFMA